MIEIVYRISTGKETTLWRLQDVEIQKEYLVGKTNPEPEEHSYRLWVTDKEYGHAIQVGKEAYAMWENYFLSNQDSQFVQMMSEIIVSEFEFAKAGNLTK